MLHDNVDNPICTNIISDFKNNISQLITIDVLKMKL